MQNQKKRLKLEKVTKPFMRGAIVDRTFFGSTGKFMFYTLVMIIAYVMSTIVMVFNNAFLIAAINIAILGTMLMIFWQSGAEAGADAVNQGEIMLQRQEKGRPVTEWERRMCYHPLKGLLTALVGSIPLIVCSVIIAVIAERQVHYPGVLPEWVSSMSGREEIYGPLNYYRQEHTLDLLTVMRPLMRFVNEPYVQLFNPEDWDAQLVLERICPLLNLLPAIAYGVGYAMGTYVRQAVHANIALGKKKQSRRLQKERRARQKAHSSGSGQLN